MVVADHGYSKKFGEENVPYWERKRTILNDAKRRNRREEIEKQKQQFWQYGRRPPLTKEQKLCGARRIA